MPIEWSDGRPFKAGEGHTYLWAVTCHRGCSAFLTNDAQEARTEWAELRCPYDATPYRYATT